MADFKNNATMAVTMKIPATTKGNIAQSDDTVGMTKLISISGIKKNATLTEANAVFDKFIGVIGGGEYDSLSAVRVIKEGVA